MSPCDWLAISQWWIPPLAQSQLIGASSQPRFWGQVVCKSCGDYTRDVAQKPNVALWGGGALCSLLLICHSMYSIQYVRFELLRGFQLWKIYFWKDTSKSLCCLDMTFFYVCIYLFIFLHKNNLCYNPLSYWFSDQTSTRFVYCKTPKWLLSLVAAR